MEATTSEFDVPSMSQSHSTNFNVLVVTITKCRMPTSSLSSNSSE